MDSEKARCEIINIRKEFINDLKKLNQDVIGKKKNTESMSGNIKSKSNSEDISGILKERYKEIDNFDIKLIDIIRNMRFPLLSSYYYEQGCELDISNSIILLGDYIRFTRHLAYDDIKSPLIKIFNLYGFLDILQNNIEYFLKLALPNIFLYNKVELFEDLGIKVKLFPETDYGDFYIEIIVVNDHGIIHLEDKRLKSHLSIADIKKLGLAYELMRTGKNTRINGFYLHKINSKPLERQLKNEIEFYKFINELNQNIKSSEISSINDIEISTMINGIPMGVD